MTSGLVNGRFSLPEWQAVKMVFLDPEQPYYSLFAPSITYPHFLRFPGLSILTAIFSLILSPVAPFGVTTSYSSGSSEPPGVGFIITWQKLLTTI